MEKKTVDNLEIHENIPAQERLWRRQAWGRNFMGLFVVAGLMGLMGRGPLSTTSVENSRFKIHYPRFVQYGSVVDLKIEGSERTFSLNNPSLEAFVVEGIQPKPE